MAEDEVEKHRFWKQRLKRHFPILKWIPAYQKGDLVADLIAGITLGLTMVPQSIAYAALAGVSAEYGLYSSFMGGFVYFIFGTVKEVSVGPTSLISLLTFEFTKELPIDFVFLFTFLCGCVEFLFGLLQFGFLVNFISMPVTTSFQSATSLIIVASQLKDFFGVPKFKSGRFLYNVYSVMQRISHANWKDTLLSICCCLFLLSLRQIKELSIMKMKNPTGNQKIIKTSLWFISISRNALCVFFSCFAAYAFTIDGEKPFQLTGHVPSGLPLFRPPLFSAMIDNRTLTFGEMLYEITPGLCVVPLISILANVTIAKAFCVGAAVDATQEMITLGICNMSGSLFGSLPTCGAFTRSAVSNSSGVRSPLAGLFTGTLILLVIKYLTPYFFFIPRATLASILICAVIFMIDLKTFLLLWKSNKRDFFCAAITFVVSLLFGIQSGLTFGIFLSIGQLLYMWARPSIQIDVKETSKGNYYLVRPDIGLFFPANDFVRNEIMTRCAQNIPIVIDCLHLKGIDFTSAQGLKGLAEYLKGKNRSLAFINMSRTISTALVNTNIELNLKECLSEKDDLNETLFESDNFAIPMVILSDKKEDLNGNSNGINEEKTPEEKALIK